ITTTDGYDDDFRRRRRYVASAHRIVAVSRFTRAATQRLLGRAGTAEDPAGANPGIALIENGVDTLRFRPGPKRDDLLAYYGLTGAFVFVSVCRLLEKKGIDQAIGGLAALLGAFPDSRLLVVGDGPDRARLEALAASLGVTEHVVFTGLVAEEELVDHYRLGDVFVMPNRELPNGDTEGFGLVFLEANACGLPVLAGCAGGSPDAVSDGVNGLVVDARDGAAVAAAMRRLREEAGLRARLASGGAEVASGAEWRGKVGGFLGVCLG
ncbi:MAG TPA: glycosyltransferase, partial [Acetobacteraceae bacterium]|nr:glycosyltransferase [Acetobacteraceae bacterium]